MSDVHVLLPADQAMVREVLKQVIASQPDLYIVAEAE
jgi:DNA-binding NarL/FixJ family response regulator